MPVSAAFANVLAAGRAQFNARVTAARHRYPAFDGAAFAGFLQSGVDPLVAAVAAHVPDRVAPTVMAAYDIAVELVAQALAGANACDSPVGRAWRDVLPAYAHVVAGHPAEAIGMLTNAVVYLGKIGNARPQAWMDAMRRLAPQVATLAQLEALGQVIGWRCGLAHFRAGALRAADGLPEPLALAAMDCAPGTSWTQVREGLQDDPWWTPGQPRDGAAHPGTSFGRFAGFGGAFAEPPLVRACAGGFVVKSGARYGLLVADAFGAVLHAATEDEFAHGQTQRITGGVDLQGSRLAIGRRTVDLDLPAGQISVTHNEHTVAVTSAVSHAIRLFPLGSARP